MDRQTLCKQITQTQNETERLLRELQTLYRTAPSSNPEIYERISTDAALLGERITCRLRHLIYVATGVNKTDYLVAAGEVHGIEIKCDNNILEIALPCLLPKRRQKSSAEFLVDPLYFTLKSYLQNNSLPRFEHCVVCFVHVYDKTLPCGRVRDYDNLELKQILDVVSSFVMADDTGLLCDTYNTTELGEKDLTRIIVMEKESFVRWLKGRKNSL